MKTRICAIGAAVLLAGCAGQPKIKVADNFNATLSAKTMVIAKRDVPVQMSTMTGGGALAAGLGGILGALAHGATTSKTNNISSQENALQDPAATIAGALANEYAQTRGVTVVNADRSIADKASVEEIIGAYGTADYILDVRTHHWMLTYIPPNLRRYGVQYIGDLRLIDTRTKEVVASGRCTQMPKKRPDSPTRDEMLANDAAKLKAHLDRAAAACVEEFRTQTLSL